MGKYSKNYNGKILTKENDAYNSLFFS